MDACDRALSMDVSHVQPGARQLLPRIDHRLLVVAVLLVVASVLRTAQMAWLSDDAFISFRYAANLHDGLGLVYNAGEFVEGYTNLLWTLALAAALHSGLDQEWMAHVLGIVAWLSLSVALAMWSWQRSRERGAPFMPLAALLNLLLEDVQRWATGGLETSLFSLLCCLGLLLLTTTRARPRRLMGAGAVLALACLTRPDGAIFAALAVLYAWFARERAAYAARARDASLVALPLAVTAMGLLSFKLHYYGELLPTAFYSKSAFDAYYSQGLRYVWLFFSRNWFALAFVPSALWLIRGHGTKLMTRDTALWLTAFVAFTYYVAHSAGDFMYARRLMPALPFLWLVFEAVLLAVPSRKLATGLLLATLLSAVLPRALYDAGAGKIAGIANEWAFYPPDYRLKARAQGVMLGEIFSNIPVRAAYAGGMAMFAYYSRLPYLVEMTGLTQYSLARQPLPERGRVGHEKSADASWLTAHRIHLLFSAEPYALSSDGHRNFDVLRFADGMTARVWTYSDAVMEPLRARADVDFVPIEVVLTQAERDIAAASPAKARIILEFLERYYPTDAAAPRAAQMDRLRRMMARKSQDP